MRFLCDPLGTNRDLETGGLKYCPNRVLETVFVNRHKEARTLYDDTPVEDLLGMQFAVLKGGDKIPTDLQHSQEETVRYEVKNFYYDERDMCHHFVCFPVGSTDNNERATYLESEIRPMLRSFAMNC